MTATRNAHVAEPFRSILADLEDGTTRMAREFAAAGREARSDVQRYMVTARLFRTAEDMLDAICGLGQRDSHVQAYRTEMWLRDKEAAHKRANAAVAEETNRIIAEWARHERD